MIALATADLGNVVWRQGHLAAARALYEESLTQGKNPWTYLRLGRVMLQQGDHRGASEQLRQSRTRFGQGPSFGHARCLEALAQLAAAEGRPDQAARLFGAVEAWRQANQWPVSPIDRADYEVVASIRAALGEAAFAAAWAEGRATRLERAVFDAMTLLDDPSAPDR